MPLDLRKRHYALRSIELAPPLALSKMRPLAGCWVLVRKRGLQGTGSLARRSVLRRVMVGYALLQILRCIMCSMV